MISYAQNAEDVVLDRVLPRDDGFYVDVGAASPDASSVTRHFYEKGWRGVNIDPRSDACAELRAKRPRDLNLQIAVGAEDGATTFYVVDEDHDLSTIDPGDLAFLRSRGFSFHAEEVQVRTLDSVLAMAEADSIDFLKIDAEGAERAVLSGLDFGRWRPKVVVVEAVKPWSRDRTDADWRSILEEHGYVEGLFDGVNLFFAPAEESDVLAGLVPASAVDQFRTAEIMALERELTWHRSRMAPRPVATPEPVHLDSPAPAPTRLMVVGQGRGAVPRLAGALAEAMDADLVAGGHPAALDWDRLPGRAVTMLWAPRTAALEAKIRSVGARVLSPARHPLRMLYDGYIRAHTNGHAPGSSADGFVDWALGEDGGRLLSITAGWWTTPATIRLRLEDLAADPDGALAPLLRRVRVERPPPLAGLDLGPSGTVPRLPTEHMERLSEAYRRVWDLLGYH
jgi:FkbM family methyltransferase